ncbi:adenosylcobinamide-phosphate synthase CbiB [Marinagarivorans algicola]|uniref:adenosylcobinamide-phosphate synthase CbiB n=1 Tax=Marinagarivorans algicola TaxID=1513270 RepID=UPI00373593CB
MLAIMVDKILGEPKKYHPLIGFGYCANVLECYLNKAITKPNRIISLKVRGIIAWLLIVLPLPLLLMGYMIFIAEQLPWYLNFAIEVTVVYFALGLRSLKEHALQVFRPLNLDDLKTARHFTGYLVSRDTSALTPKQMTRATIESMLENGHDAVIATLVWYSIGGLPAVLLHRLANTLDAMWGYKTPQFKDFGWCAARIDDALGFISAKICTLLYAIQSPKHFNSSLYNAATQGGQYKSHNGGWVMAAGATALQIKLGGSAVYHNQSHTSPTLGQGNNIQVNDIIRSINLVNNAAYLWCLLLFFIALLAHI